MVQNCGTNSTLSHQCVPGSKMQNSLLYGVKFSVPNKRRVSGQWPDKKGYLTRQMKWKILINEKCTLSSAEAPSVEGEKRGKWKIGGARGTTGKAKRCPPRAFVSRAFVSILSRLRALTFHLSPIPSPYEKIRGLCGGERKMYHIYKIYGIWLTSFPFEWHAWEKTQPRTPIVNFTILGSFHFSWKFLCFLVRPHGASLVFFF